MSENIKDTMVKAEKLAIKIKKQMKRYDLDYTVQVSINSVNPSKIKFACQITPPAEGVAPITFVANTGEELLAQMEANVKKFDYDEVQRTYHNFQIKDHTSIIESHKEALEELEKPAEDRISYLNYEK